MIRKKWTDGEPVLSVETEDESHKALSRNVRSDVLPSTTACCPRTDWKRGKDTAWRVIRVSKNAVGPPAVDSWWGPLRAAPR